MGFKCFCLEKHLNLFKILTTMKPSWDVGFNFGLTSGVITTLGLMTGLYSGTNSKMVVLSGILIIAVADSLSDALGIHISEEARIGNNHKDVWTSTISTFLFKLIFALTFAIPFLFLAIKSAIIVCFVWGAFLITAISIKLAKRQKLKPYFTTLEHLGIAVLVVVCTYFIGKWIGGLV